MTEIRLQAPSISRWRVIAYWAVTSIVALETAVGAEWDLTHHTHVVTVLNQLGYPLYILSIMGVWKILAVVALLVPGYVRIKEWAYAGLFFIYSGAAFSHFATGAYGDGTGPMVFSVLTLVSWSLRPPSRKLSVEKIKGSAVVDKRWPLSKKIISWVTLIMLEFSLLSAGIMELVHFSGNVDGICHQLGYPLYFLTIQGIWKLLAGIAIALPGFRVLKEWAYAGVFFSMTGAVVSNAVRHMGAGHIFAPLFITLLCVISWALRPAWRKVNG